MRINRIIGSVVFLSGCMSVFSLHAAEILYSPDARVETKQVNKAPMQQELLVNPKLVDDADLNFDEIMLEDMSTSFAESNQEQPDQMPKEENTLPILQKNEQQILPSQDVLNSQTNVPEQPRDNTEENFLENKSLTEVINEQKQGQEEAQVSNEEYSENQEQTKDAKSEGTTWINKLKSPLNALTSSEDSSTLEGLMESGGRKKSNASVFDISGAMLRMSGQQIDDALKKRGFQKIYQKLDIPNFIRWRNEEKCRNRGVTGYERLQSCIVDMAKKEKHQYVALTKYSKFSTKEEISVSYTSNFTNNKVYRITYKSMSPSTIGTSPKAQYLRNIKIYDFWKRINQKYGAPDNKDEITWGLGQNKPYMKANTGFLLLEDPMLRELDYTRMSREDQRYMNTDIYSF